MAKEYIKKLSWVKKNDSPTWKEIKKNFNNCLNYESQFHDNDNSFQSLNLYNVLYYPDKFGTEVKLCKYDSNLPICQGYILKSSERL